jgi:hypothetical protein
VRCAKYAPYAVKNTIAPPIIVKTAALTLMITPPLGAGGVALPEESGAVLDAVEGGGA